MLGILKRASRRFRRDDGSSTIEFVILFPVLMTLFFTVFEAGLMMTRGVMLDRAVDITIREVRLGTLNPMSAVNFKNRVCENTVIINDCLNILTVEMDKISTSTWEGLDDKPTCVDRANDPKPIVDFIAGAGNELMMVRVCAIFDPFFPTAGLAAQTGIGDDGEYALVTMSTFVNEP